MPPRAKTPTSAPASLSRVCGRCGHRLLTVMLDNGVKLEVDTQRRCWVGTGREENGLPVYSGSRAYPEHAPDCLGEGDVHA